MTQATKVIKFIQDHCRLSTTGEPFILLPFQRQLVEDLYTQVKGKRKYTRCLVTTGKKSFGKTVLASALSLYHLVADGVQSPLVILGASAKEQAGELYREAAFMVRNNDKLNTALKCLDSIKTIRYPARNGVLKAVSSDNMGRSKGGWNCSFVVLDECALHQNRHLYDMLKGSMVARAEPLLLMLSNAGWNKSHFYFQDIYQHAKQVKEDPKKDPSFLPVIHEVPELADWHDRTQWALGNPGIVSEGSYEDDYQEALRTRAGESYFRRFRLNQWTKTATTWIDLSVFDFAEQEPPEPLETLPVYIGVDLSSSQDLSSVAAIWIGKDYYYLKTYNFATAHSLERRAKQNLTDYNNFALANHLTIIEGNAIDYEQVRTVIRAIKGEVQTIVFDAWGSLETSQLLMREGYEVHTFAQGNANFHEPTSKFQTMLEDRTLLHDGNSCLRWSLSNVQLKQDNKGLFKPCRATEAQKIDPVIASVMALSQAILHKSREESRTDWVVFV